MVRRQTYGWVAVLLLGWAVAVCHGWPDLLLAVMIMRPTSPLLYSAAALVCAPADEQLFKDIEGVLEEVFRDGLTALAKRQPGGQLQQPQLFASLLRLWDGVCCLYAGKAKPQAWVALLLRLAKLFAPEARGEGADSVAAELASGPMQRMQRLWRDLTPLATIRQQFETADVESGGAEGGGAPGERAAKRRRA